MLSQLSDKISRAIETVTDAKGSAKVHAAVEIICSQLDDEERGVLQREALCVRVKRFAERGVRAAEDGARQPVTNDLFPHLRRGYALDEEGRVIKNTDDLTRMDLERIIRIREESIAKDMAHLKHLREARATLDPTWSLHPDWTFSQVCRAHRVAA